MLISDIARNTPSETSAISVERGRAAGPAGKPTQPRRQVRQQYSGAHAGKEQRQLDARAFEPAVGDDPDYAGDVDGEDRAQEGEVVDLRC
jgi:hypothetical protein